MRAKYLRLLLLAVLVTSSGCIDAVQEGVTGGISEGFEDVISDFVESILGDALSAE